MGTQLYWQSQGWLCITAYQENPFLGEMTGRDSPVISWAEQKNPVVSPNPARIITLVNGHVQKAKVRK